MTVDWNDFYAIEIRRKEVSFFCSVDRVELNESIAPKEDGKSCFLSRLFPLEDGRKFMKHFEDLSASLRNFGKVVICSEKIMDYPEDYEGNFEEDDVTDHCEIKLLKRGNKDVCEKVVKENQKESVK